MGIGVMYTKLRSFKSKVLLTYALNVSRSATGEQYDEEPRDKTMPPARKREKSLPLLSANDTVNKK
jgi:hypothetical protein